MRIVLVAVTIFCAFISRADALVYLEKEGLFFYFPDAETEIAARLTEKLPEIERFLSDRRIPVERPLHIILDEKLDAPEVVVHIIPHREIRIPLRAPGVLEDGYMAVDPWTFFLFKGLCLQGIYGLRSGIPEALHKGFGEIVSPNVIMPQWVEDGISNLLYTWYLQKNIQDPFESAIFQASPPPDLEIISNHPQIWPGKQGYSIYGKPFIDWIYKKYGWAKILDFLHLHGRGIIPIEIDLKLRKVFGKTGAGLWREFQGEYARNLGSAPAFLITGYWGEPFLYWNQAGVYPGKVQVQSRGRYGYATPDGTLWLSEFDGASEIYRYSKGSAVAVGLKHVWDPGPGRVAVTRKGHRPWVVVFPESAKGEFKKVERSETLRSMMIPAPPGVIQLSGPVRNEKGQIAVAGNLAGNWDIWVYDGQWQRLTDHPSIEMDPWWDKETLVYASNISGKFQIHEADGRQITEAEYGAVLPRHGWFLNLNTNGWRLERYQAGRSSFAEFYVPTQGPLQVDAEPKILESNPYNPFKSLWPNYIRPDVFAAESDLQLGIATRSRDVDGDYLINAGIRYSFDYEFFALQAGFQVKEVGTQFARYPLEYETALAQRVDESRNEVKLFWRPLEHKENQHAVALRASDGIELSQGVEFSLNWRNFKSLEEERSTEDESWAGLVYTNTWGILRAWGNLEIFTENRQSLSGGIQILFGDRTFTSVYMMAGRTWGDPVFGHNTFRIGGNVSEGYFTRRPSRLFPIRGFDSNILEAAKAATGGVEVFWPLANLQAGYQALPVFLHRLRLGTFVDAGFASDSVTSDDLLVGAGFELVTSLEIAWGNLSAFRVGISWPIVRPDYLDEKGPVIVFQLGRPL